MNISQMLVLSVSVVITASDESVLFDLSLVIAVFVGGTTATKFSHY